MKDDFHKNLNRIYNLNPRFIITYDKIFDLFKFGADKKKISDFFYEYVNMTSDENKINKEDRQQEITNNNYFKLLNSTLCIIALDLLFLFMIVFPLCSMIEMYKTKYGFTYVFQIVLIAYQCDNGALLFGKLFGKNNFGFPITPTKTYEGIFGAFFLG